MRYISRTGNGLVAVTKPGHNDQVGSTADIYLAGPRWVRRHLGEDFYFIDQFRAAFRLDLTKP